MDVQEMGVTTAAEAITLTFFFLMIRRPPRSTQSRSSAASDVYKRQLLGEMEHVLGGEVLAVLADPVVGAAVEIEVPFAVLSLMHISEPTRPY